jgi:superfamily I DNA and/or RNA helicase
MYAAIIANQPLRVAVSCHTHAAISEVITKLATLKTTLQHKQHAMAKELQRVGLFRYRKNDSEIRQAGVTYVADKEQMLTHINEQSWCVVGATPTSIAALADGGNWSDVLILDEASQLSVPQAIVAAQVLVADGMLIVIGDPRQMPVIVSHDRQTKDAGALPATRCSARCLNISPMVVLCLGMQCLSLVSM